MVLKLRHFTTAYDDNLTAGSGQILQVTFIRAVKIAAKQVDKA